MADLTNLIDLLHDELAWLGPIVNDADIERIARAIAANPEAVLQASEAWKTDGAVCTYHQGMCHNPLDCDEVPLWAVPVV